MDERVSRPEQQWMPSAVRSRTAVLPVGVRFKGEPCLSPRQGMSPGSSIRSAKARGTSWSAPLSERRGVESMRQAGLYLNCPRCGLSIGMRSPWLVMTHCPRCIARAHTAVEMFSSEMPASMLYASGSLPTADTRTAPRKPVPAGYAPRDDSEPEVEIAATRAPRRSHDGGD